MARPTKLTPEVEEKIIGYIRGGNYIEAAAAAAGINKVTLYRWLKRGAPGNEKQDRKGIYREFSNAVEKACAEAQIIATYTIRNDGSWQSKAWWLERRFPKLWGRVEYRGEAEGAEADRGDEILNKLLEKLDTAEKNLKRKREGRDKMLDDSRETGSASG